ncbi:MerR family transcriptional regulator [[Clostridium] innocuum]|uniref:MerR family transcriptional regulator n=1 Tax=Clostridium innocuum TaxID=1522 RepID=UPI000678F63A|nr:MerR family transcriptional regulator [[Clostridium] innocuum]
MKKLNEVCKIVGLNRRTIQEYEFNGLAKTPETKNKYGHLLYSDEDIERLWQLRFYKELGYKKRDIEKIFNDPKYDKQKSLEAQIKLLEKKKQDLENLINVAKGMSTMGVNTFSRKSSSTLLDDMPFDTAISVLGLAFKNLSDEDDLDEMITDSLNEDDLDLWFENIEKIMEQGGKGKAFDNIEVQDLVHKLYDLTSPLFSPSMMMFEWAYLCLVPGSEFANEIDQIFGVNKSIYLFEAIQTFIKNNKNNAYDNELLDCFENIRKLGLKKYPANSDEVQEEVRKIHRLIEQMKIYNEKGQMNLMTSFSNLFASNEYKQIIDGGKDKGVSWFISRALEIYIKNIEGGNANE